MTHKKRAADMSDRILAATISVIQNTGLQKLTIDAVAAEVGISKGGILHHFGTKDALVSGVIQHVLSTISEEVEQEFDGIKNEGGTYLQAIIQYARGLFVDDREIPRALLLAVSGNADASKSANEFLKNILNRAKEKSNSDNAEILFFATLGVVISRALDIANLDDKQTHSLFSTMKAMAMPKSNAGT